MVSFQTITLPIFMALGQGFYNSCNTKIVPFNIERLLHPIAIAYWFAGSPLITCLHVIIPERDRGWDG